MRLRAVIFCGLTALTAFRLCASSATVANRMLTIALDADASFADLASEYTDDLTGNVITNVTVTGAYRLTVDSALTGYVGTWTIRDGSVNATGANAFGSGKITMASLGNLEFSVANGTWANDIEFAKAGYATTSTVGGWTQVNLCFNADTTLNGDVTAVGSVCFATRGCNTTINGAVTVNGTILNKSSSEGQVLTFKGKVKAKALTGTTDQSSMGKFALCNPANDIPNAKAYYGRLELSEMNVLTNSVLRQGYSEQWTSLRGLIEVKKDQTIDRLAWPDDEWCIVPDGMSKSSAEQNRHILSILNGSLVTMRGTASDRTDARFTGTGSLAWCPVGNPDGDPFTYTLERGRPHTLQGALIVSNGTLRVTSDPTFANIDTITVGDGGTFDFDVTTGDNLFPKVTTLSVGKNGRADFGDYQPFEMANLVIRMSDTGFLTLKPGTYAPLKLFLDGTQIAGLYTGLNGTEEEATKVAWLDDDVVIDAPEVEIVSDPHTWDAGGGDTFVNNRYNWNGDVLPTFTDGSLLATFAAGSLATVNTPVRFKGAIVNTSSFGFEPVSGGTVEIGEEGLKLNSGTVTNGAETTVFRNQSWTLAGGTTLIQTGAIRGADALTRKLTFDGAGYAEITGRGATSDYAGSVNVYNGTMLLKGDEPLGKFVTGSKAKVTVQSLNGSTRLKLGGMRTTKPVLFNAENLECIFETVPGVTNEFAGPVTFAGTGCPSVNGGIVVFSGGLNVTGIAVLDYHGTLVFRNVPSYFNGQWQDGSCDFVFECSGNYMWANTTYVTGSRIVLNAPYALKWDNGDGTYKYSDFMMVETSVGDGHGAGIVELCGYPQTIGNWYMDATTVDLSRTYFVNSSETPSDLHMIQSRYESSKCQTNMWRNDFKGKINLYKEGLSPVVVSNVAVSAVGSLNVVAGRLDFALGATWRGTTNVTVAAGAQLGVTEPTVFTRETTISLPDETGAMTLNNASTLHVRYVRVGGKDLPPGLYCAPGRGVTGVTTEHAAFAGTGRIKVRETRGLVLFVLDGGNGTPQ